MVQCTYLMLKLCFIWRLGTILLVAWLGINKFILFLTRSRWIMRYNSLWGEISAKSTWNSAPRKSTSENFLSLRTQRTRYGIPFSSCTSWLIWRLCMVLDKREQRENWGKCCFSPLVYDRIKTSWTALNTNAFELGAEISVVLNPLFFKQWTRKSRC